MRISTNGMHHNALTAMLQQQSILSKTQNQIATGKRVQTPADDPVGAVHIMELQRALKEYEQYDANANIAGNRLSLEEQALADVTTLLGRVRELTVQANNASVDDSGRRMIATEIRGRMAELGDIANRKDANGEYLFAGFSTQTRPFVVNGTAVSYAGDQGNRLLQVGPTQRIADSHSGFDVFLNIREGNGTFVVDTAGGNTGTGSITSGTLSNPAAWVPDDYTIRFTSASAYEVIDSATPTPNVVTTGTYTGERGTISFNGVNVEITGTPATGDQFLVYASQDEDLFTTLNNLVTTLESPGSTAAARAEISTDLGRTLQQLDQSGDHILSIRAQVGTRLSALDTAESTRDEQKVELQRMTSDLQDLDYAEALTRMNQQLVGLQAAQASYSRISQLSLFNYLT